MRSVVHLLAWTVASTAITTPSAPITPGIRVVALNVPSAGKPGFTLLPPHQTGVTFTNLLDEWTSADNRVLNSGSGVAVGDFDNDGWLDLFFCSLDRRNRLFRNRGHWRFEDVTLQAGLDFEPLFYRAAVFADINGDGWLDLLVGSVGRGVFCFLNDQRGHFTRATAEAGTASPYANATLALADIDGNGTLDLYACNYRTDDIRDWPRVPLMFVNKKPTVPPQLRDRIVIENGTVQEFGEPDILYLNDGHAHFRSVSFTNGAFFDERGNVLTDTPLDWGLAAAFRDLNHDGAPDLYVCNDYWTPDRLWINGGRGRFRAIDSQALRKIPASSMGVDFADINRDGHVDIFVVDMLSRSSELRRRQMVAKNPVPPLVGDMESRVQTPQNTLLLNRGDGTFAEIACFAGVAASDWSWSPVFLDVDLDGYDDLLVTAGHVRDIQDLDATAKIRAQQESWRRTPMAATNLQRAFVEAKREHSRLYPPLDMPVVAFRNRGDLRFEEATASWGLNVTAVNHGLALGDLDNDGDADVIVNRLGAPAALFRNDAAKPRVPVRLRGKPPNTQAIGAKIELLGAAISNQAHEVTCGGHYMSGSDTVRVFAPGSSQSLNLRVTWRDGSVTDVSDVKPNHLYEIDQARALAAPPRSVAPTNPPTLFQDASSLLSHIHHEDPFDDFARQPLLPRKLSQNGPGVAWFDMDQDGWPDLIVGSGKGGRLAVFQNRQGRSFERVERPDLNANVIRDQTTILGWHRGTKPSALLVASAAYEDDDTNASCVSLLEVGRVDTSPIPGTLVANSNLHLGLAASIGPLALADLEGDGDLDLFAGGQMIPGQYPRPASSLLFRCSQGILQLDQENSAALAGIGLINSAVWTDLNGDGLPELVLACEWGPLRVFENRGGRLDEVTRDWGLAEFTGLWLGVTAGDFDGDGKLDLVAGNWGLNSHWRASPQQSLTLFHGDFSGRGAVDLLETEFDPARRELVPIHPRDLLAANLPFVSERFPTHLAFSRATALDIIAHRPAHQARAVVLASMLFLNRSGRFEERILPDEAQFAPAFAVCAADFDGDGHEDVFMGQNFFAFRVEDSRLDAGRGLVLRGDGRGNLAPVPGQFSGIKISGEQRGAATADFDGDRRVDLVVAQNGAATRLYRNSRARPGLRVRLVGPKENPEAIGAVFRLRFGERWGPARELHAGAGWWSQDGGTAILGAPDTPTAVWVRWPGGKITEETVAPGAAEVTISSN